jgi:hypothetical protein
VIAGYICRLACSTDCGRYVRQLTSSALLIIGILGCTGNSIFNDEISSLDGYSFHGSVTITGLQNAERIYVWLEAFDVGTWTDNTGYFELRLPPAGTQSGGGLTGEFSVFYYIANYGLESSRIYVEKGKLQYGERSLDEKGAIREHISLSKILEITTDTDTIIYREFSGHIPITVSLQNLIDTVDVEYLSIYENAFDGLFLLADTASTAQAIAISYSEIKKNFIVTKPIDLTMTLWVSKYLFEPGDYYMIPYIYVKQKDLPIQLLRSITKDYHLFGNEYLKIPFRLNAGMLTVLNEKPGVFD